jgi:DNA polymerase III epsilon subunit-like protein
MKVLVFDTETTGLPQTKIINEETLEKWPHIVQFSFAMFDTDTKSIIKFKDFIVKLPNKIEISQDSINIHGITKDISNEKGFDINIVIKTFFEYLEESELLVGHNISFDINMLYIELLRIIYKKEHSQDDIFDFKKKLHKLANYKNIYCTMQESIDLCAIKKINKKGEEYNKFPKLIELHEKLFGTIPKNLHNSFVDILVTMRCFMQLKWEIDLLETSDNYNNLVSELEVY